MANLIIDIAYPYTVSCTHLWLFKCMVATGESIPSHTQILESAETERKGEVNSITPVWLLPKWRLFHSIPLTAFTNLPTPSANISQPPCQLEAFRPTEPHNTNRTMQPYTSSSITVHITQLKYVGGKPNQLGLLTG